jgi:hypothetical protein
MPAVLDEAFNSPFNRNVGVPIASSNSSNDTESIRNPQYNFQPFNHPYNSLFPRTQSQTQSFPEPVKNMVPVPGPASSPAPAPTPVAQPAMSTHDCDRLIAMIMACAVCRNKIRELLKTNSSVPTTQSSPSESTNQSGGALPAINTVVIGNFLFGIAIIFLVDKIVKKRGCC